MLWIISLITALIIIVSIYYSMHIRNAQLKIISNIVFSLLLIGETLDLLTGTIVNSLLAAFIELLEMFITIGFFALLYYLKLKSEKKKTKHKRIKYDKK